jgi:hypothetical protein
MRNILTALALGVAVLLPAVAASAESEVAGGDHETVVTSTVAQGDSVNLGTIAGSVQTPQAPYFNLRLENRDN